MCLGISSASTVSTKLLWYVPSYVVAVIGNHLVLLYFQCCINIIFDRVGRKDPVTRGLEIAVHWCGFDIDLAFWNQHISFLLVGCIVVTSIRGLLLTLTKVGNVAYYIYLHIYIYLYVACSFSIVFRQANQATLLC